MKGVRTERGIGTALDSFPVVENMKLKPNKRCIAGEISLQKFSTTFL